MQSVQGGQEDVLGEIVSRHRIGQQAVRNVSLYCVRVLFHQFGGRFPVAQTHLARKAQIFRIPALGRRFRQRCRLFFFARVPFLFNCRTSVENPPVH